VTKVDVLHEFPKSAHKWLGTPRRSRRVQITPWKWPKMDL